MRTTITYKFEACRHGQHGDCVKAKMAEKSDDFGTYEIPARCDCNCHSQSVLFAGMAPVSKQRNLF